MISAAQTIIVIPFDFGLLFRSVGVDNNNQRGLPHVCYHSNMFNLRKITGIYCITCTANGRKYVGKATGARGVSGRWAQHRKAARRGRHHSPHFQACWDKYGESAFVWEVLEPYVDGDPYVLEQKWMDALRPVLNSSLSARPGTNPSPARLEQMRAIGRRNKGRRHTEEAKALMRAARANVPKHPEHRQALAQSIRRRTRRPFVAVDIRTWQSTLFEHQADARKAAFGITGVRSALAGGHVYRDCIWAYVDEITVD